MEELKKGLFEEHAKLKKKNGGLEKTSSLLKSEEDVLEYIKEVVEEFAVKNKILEDPIPNFAPLNNIVIDGSTDLEVQFKISQEVKNMVWYRMSHDSLDQDDLTAFYVVLEKYASSIPTPNPELPLGYEGENKYIIYKDFYKVREEVCPRIKCLLTSKLFMRLLTDDPYGRVSIMSIFNYIMKKTWLKQTRLGLMTRDCGKGFIPESDMESYLKELIPTLYQLRNMDPTFEPFYICTASRKFFFFLDPPRKGKIRIVDVLASGLIDDILDLREEEPRDTPNWFSLESALRTYGHYLTLDKDRNGMLSKQEFMRYQPDYHSLTAAFVDRLFIECITYDGEMDYRTYVDFVLAMNNKKDPQSLHYFMKLLDLNHKGYLDAFDLHYFFKDMERQLGDHPEFPRFSDVKDEIFDMVKPADPLKITLKDLVNSSMGETVVTILIDANGFLNYDNRESTPPDMRDGSSSEV